MAALVLPMVCRAAIAIALVAVAAPVEGVPRLTAAVYETAGGQARSVASDPAFALLSDGRLVQVNLATARATRSRALTGLARIVEGRSLALSLDRLLLYVLVGRFDGPQEVVTVDAATLGIRQRFALPDDLVFRTIAVGPRSGDIFLFGNTAVTEQGSAAYVVVVRSTDRTVAMRQQLRAADGRNWYVFDAAVDRDERRGYVSYHGGCVPGKPPACTTGADSFTLGGANVSRCPADATRNAGCLPQAHGQIVAYGVGALAASGGPLIQFDSEGHETRRLPTRLPRNHTMTFAVTANRRAALVINPCPSRGLSVVPLGSGPTTIRAGAICGTKIAAAKSGRVLVAKTSLPVPQWIQGQLLVHDPTRTSPRSITISSEALDVLAP